MSFAAPTVVTIETDSVWVLLLAASLVTVTAALLLRNLIRRPGGRASGLLLLLPLLVPPVGAFLYAHAVLPEVSVLEPVDSLFRSTGRLAHLLLLSDGHQRVRMYALSGTAGRMLLIVGASLSAIMIARRLLGAWLVHRLLQRCGPPGAVAGIPVAEVVASLCDAMGMQRCPEVLTLPEGHPGAFAVGGRHPRILVSGELLSRLELDEAEAVLAHELAHLEAHDVQLVFAAGMLRDLMAWNPLAHVSFRTVAADREVEADRRAAEVTGEPLAVASGLLKVCEGVRRSRLAPAALGFLRPRASIKHRVANLLAIADGSMSPRAARLPYLLAAAAVVVLGLVAAAQVAQQNDGAFALVLGAPHPTSDRLWVPPKAPSDHRTKGHPPVAVIRNVPITSDVTYREQDLPKWIDAVMQRIKRHGVSPATLDQLREDWTAVPLLQFHPQPAWMGIYRVRQAPM